MVTIEEKGKKLDELYPRATSPENYLQMWGLTIELEKEIDAQKVISVKQAAQALLSGYWGRYHQLLKFGGTNELIDEFHNRVRQWYAILDSDEAIDLKISYGYLLSVILSHLKKKPEEAFKIDQEVAGLAERSKNIVSILRLAASQGLTEMKKEDYRGAIAIFEKGWKLYTKHEDNPETFRHFGNICNNLGLSEINLSKQLKDRKEKVVFLGKGYADLVLATSFYLQEASPPVRHLEGIKNRSRIALRESFKVFSFILFFAILRHIWRLNRLLKKLPKE